MAHHAVRFISNRRSLREFRATAAAIIFHHEDPETAGEPRTSPFVCGSCRHTRTLCTCRKVGA